MLKRLAFVMTVCLVVGVAFAKPTRITSFQAFAGESPTADGMAFLNYSAGQDRISAQVIVTDLIGSAEYAVLLREPGVASWCLDETTANFPFAVFEPHPGPAGGFFFPIDAVNQSTNPVGNLNYHGVTTTGSGDFSDSDVIIVLQAEWENPIQLPVPDGRLRVRVRMVGTSTEIAACQ